METVLVTGAAGFIGSNLVRELLSRGYRVVGVDNFDDAYDPSFKEEHIQDLTQHPQFTLVRLDIRDGIALRAFFEKERPTRVAHLAAKADTRAAVLDPFPYIENNITGTLNVFEAAKAVGVLVIAAASSSSVYGNDQAVPWREDMTADCPLSPYGATKRSGELFAHAYHHNFGMNITCLRYFNAYGEYNRPNMVPYLWTKALLTDAPIQMSGDGSRKRDYTYIGDIVSGTIAALERPLGFEVINLGNHTPVALTELLAGLEAVTGKAAIVERYESHTASVEVTYANIAKAKKLLDWEPKTALSDGLSHLVTWLKTTSL